MSRRELGWWLAGMLALVLSMPAWSLDLDQACTVAELDASSAQIASTLGRGRSIGPQNSIKAHREMKVQLLPSRKAKAAKKLRHRSRR